MCIRDLSGDTYKKKRLENKFKSLLIFVIKLNYFLS